MRKSKEAHRRRDISDDLALGVYGLKVLCKISQDLIGMIFSDCRKPHPALSKLSHQDLLVIKFQSLPLCLSLVLLVLLP